jgi:hypothetical protein
MANIRIAMINANTVLTDDQVQAAVRAADPGASGLRPTLGDQRRPELRAFGRES